ncbi:ATP-binding protein [Magnetovibrio blakemorei]|uniref:ATP-binding protein n=1 Tax=Magnetovibrio blakemorei TaxID=28181 RepID=UPI00147CBC7E|nr:ATP-binding protein [Magnetovibrio blakemorei]
MRKVFPSIRHRLLTALFLLAGFGVVSSLWNIALMAQFEQRLVHLSGESIPVLVAAYEAARQGEAISKGTSGVVLTHDKGAREAFVARINDQFKGLDTQLAILADKDIEAERLTNIQFNKKALLESFFSLTKAVEKLDEAVKLGIEAQHPELASEVDRLLLGHRYHADRMTDAVAGLANARTGEIEQSVKGIMKRLEWDRRLLNAYTLGAIVLAIVVIVYLDNRVMSRVVGLQRAMRSVASGGTRQKIPRGGDDEIADMADALGTFVEKLAEREERLQDLVQERSSALASANVDLEITDRRLRNLFEVASDWFWELNADFKITYMSPQFFEVFGNPPDVFNHTIFDRLMADDVMCAADELQQHFLNLREHRPFGRFEFSIRTPDGPVRYLQSSGIPVFDEKGNFSGFQGALTDVTEEKQTELELRHAQKMQALGNLAGGVAHSFNNIFQPILILSELSLNEVAADSPACERLQIAIDACRRGKALGDRILLYSRQDEPERCAVNAHSLVKGTLDLFRSSAPTSVRLDEDLDAQVGDVFGDSAQLEVLLLNLASNAVDAIGEKAGEIKIRLSREPRERVEYNHDGEMVHEVYAKISVSDNGCGIAPQVMERIFDPFFTTKGLGKGTGLGLSMASGIVTMHGGGINVSSVLGQGTTFDVFLPIVEGGIQAAEDFSETKPVRR